MDDKHIATDIAEAGEEMIEAPETAHHAHGHGTGRRWFDIAMAIAILLVSAGSLYVALHTGHTMEALVRENERLVRAQSTPILQYDHGNGGEDGQRRLEFSITNVGTGPARVMWARLTRAGKTYSKWSDFIADSGPGTATFTTSPINRTVLSQGEVRRLVRWTYPADPLGRARWSTIDKQRFEAKATACYCSVFEQCWISDMEADLPRPVERC